jgi:hypothetical protein
MAKTGEKNLRILTVRNRDGYEAIELASNGVFFWIFETTNAGGSFPCSRDFMEKEFAQAGRRFDPSKLPTHFVGCPYTDWNVARLGLEAGING